MKKLIIYGVAVAALAVGGFAIASKSSAPILTAAQMENLEALSSKEAWVDIEFDVICVTRKQDYCVIKGMPPVPDAGPEEKPKNPK